MPIEFGENILQNDDFVVETDNSGDLVQTHKPTGAQFKYDTSRSSWVPVEGLYLDDEDITGVETIEASDATVDSVTSNSATVEGTATVDALEAGSVSTGDLNIGGQDSDFHWKFVDGFVFDETQTLDVEFDFSEFPIRDHQSQLKLIISVDADANGEEIFMRVENDDGENYNYTRRGGSSLSRTESDTEFRLATATSDQGVNAMWNIGDGRGGRLAIHGTGDIAPTTSGSPILVNGHISNFGTPTTLQILSDDTISEGVIQLYGRTLE